MTTVFMSMATRSCDGDNFKSETGPQDLYCLEIQVVSTEDDKALPPPHALQVLTVEYMVHEGRTGLTEAVVTGLGRAVLFYGHRSLGEGLNLGEGKGHHVYLVRNYCMGR